MQNRGTVEIADTYFIFDYILRSLSEVPDCRLQRDTTTRRFFYVGPDAGKEFNPIQAASDKSASIYSSHGDKESQVTLKSGEEKNVIDILGAGIIDRLTLKCKSPPAVHVRIFYDNSTDAAVDCRLDRRFGMCNSMILEHEADSYSLYLLMPYRKHWRLVLKNTSSVQEVSIGASVAYRQTPSLPDNLAYLHAAWNSADGKNIATYPLVSVSGRGHFVGMLLYQPTTTVWPSDHAGADFIYGDASTSKPFVLRAIGGEDYFCAAYFGDDYATPFVGVTKDYMHGGMRYRFHLEAPIPFTESINVDFAIFQGNSYASVAFWYQNTPGRSVSAPSIPWRCLGPFDPEAVPDEPRISILDPSKQPDFGKAYSVKLRNYLGARFERQARW